MHLLLIGVLESLAVPAVPATVTQGSEEVLSSLIPTSSPKAGWKTVPTRAAGSQEELELTLAALPFWPREKYIPGSLQGLAVLKAAALLSPLGSGMCAPHVWLIHAEM